MFKKISQEKELAQFHFIWMTVWREKGFEFEFAERVLDRRLILSPQGDYCGTAEIRSYATEAAELEHIAPFSSMPEVASNPDRVVVADKIALLREHRGKYMNEMLSCLVHMSDKQGALWCAALLEPVLSRALRITFKVPMIVMGEKQPYKGDYVVPVLIPVGEIIKDPARHAWLSYSHCFEENQPAFA
ncbi:hypothetical protein SAMN05444162_4527 [Paenibacillaceae bacterium GAS479]|nr:hypothetical protein SAMN05444162_4527 [Paenibacillaceae bacterium GAS479]